MIKLSNINISFDKPLIKDGEIEILNGEITSLIGESGCGKSSLLYLVGLISSNERYEYVYDGELLDLKNDKKMSLIRKKKIGYIFQENNLIDSLNIKDNFIITARLAGIPVTDEDIEEYLRFVKLDISSKSYPRQLSSGERQRAAIACVLSKEPDLIIADEPTSALDSTNSNLIMEVFNNIAYEKNKKIIIATHNEKIYEQTDAIYEIVDRRIILQRDGKLFDKVLEKSL